MQNGTRASRDVGEEAMMLRATLTRTLAIAGMVLFSPIGVAFSADPLKLAVPTFLTGPAAGPYGIPSRNGAELIIEAINEGKLPAPYASRGLAGKKIEVEFVDEAGGNIKQVSEFRNLVQRRGVDIVLGYVSSGTCEAITPVAEELKVLTIFTICGTPRIFEAAPRHYVFRTQGLSTAEAVGAARYVAEMMPDLQGFTGINQNYAWGQDSWREFEQAMRQLVRAEASQSPLWPKVFQGQYASEISALLLSKDQLVHSSFWGSDLDSFVLQAQGRGLFETKKVFLTMGAAGAVFRLGKNMPKGIFVGARGPFSIMAKNIDTPLNKWFIENYIKRFGEFPPAPAYQTASGLLALKAAYEKAAEGAGKEPSQEQIIKAFEGLRYESLTATIDMALSNGHQAVMDISFGETDFDEKTGAVVLKNVRSYPPSCTNPPAGVTSQAWLDGGIAKTCEAAGRN